MMDPDDFRACLISMGYDLVSLHLATKKKSLTISFRSIYLKCILLLVLRYPMLYVDIQC